MFVHLGPARAERRDRPRVPSSNGAKSSPAAAAAQSAAADLVVDDDSSDDDDEDGPVMKDGTINASDRNPKPLRELLPIRSSASSASPTASCSSNNAEHRVSGVPPLAAKGPSRPLPPTPDDDDTMTRRGDANGGGASGGLIMNNNSSAVSSPAIRSNMPDLLPQTPSGGPPTPVSRGGGGHESHHGAGPQGSPLTGLQVTMANFFFIYVQTLEDIRQLVPCRLNCRVDFVIRVSDQSRGTGTVDSKPASEEQNLGARAASKVDVSETLFVTVFRIHIH